VNDPALRGIVREYRKLRGRLQFWCDGVVSALKNDPVIKKLKPILLKGRLKEPKRLKDKVVRKHDPDERPICRENLVDEIEDLAGVRLVVAQKGHVARVVERVSGLGDEGVWSILGENHYVWHPDELKEVEGLGLTADAKEFPYCSRHFILAPWGASYDTPNLVKCELQVRTVLEEAIFENDHRIRYSGKANAGEVEETLKYLVETLEVCDAQLARVYEKVGI